VKLWHPPWPTALDLQTMHSVCYIFCSLKRGGQPHACVDAVAGTDARRKDDGQPLDPAMVEETIVWSDSSSTAAAIGTHENNNNKTMITLVRGTPSFSSEEGHAVAAADHVQHHQRRCSSSNGAHHVNDIG